MATGIFAILDDIAVLADDVAVNTKIATQKTVAILGDDLAVNAEQAMGFAQSRELQVIWAITKGSFINKLIILPLAFVLSAFAPWSIPIILVFGGLYLSYEGAEKVEEFFSKHKKEDTTLLESTNEDVLEVEQKKIKAAIRTDFILSIEIVILALGTVLNKAFLTQIFATIFVAFIATIGVYGLVALIVRIDNVGFWLISKKYTKSGNFLVALMPKLINALSIIGTIAMLLVGGGLLSHNVELIHHLAHNMLPTLLNNFIIGSIGGFLIFFGVNLVQKFKGTR